VKPSTSPYLRGRISNGNEVEQALIRRWWQEFMGAAGVLVWEYCLESRFFADAVVFLDLVPAGTEVPGQQTARRYPLNGARVVICEAKANALSPDLIGQALVYRSIAVSCGAQVESTNVFAADGSPRMLAVAHEHGLQPIIGGL
jgi:hypothetical protein